MSDHIPVLLEEVIKYLYPKPNQNFIDATIGGGGHAFEILRMIEPDGKLLGIEWDEQVLLVLNAKLKTQSAKLRNRIILENGNFADLKKIVEKHNFGPVHGILFDLGMSSWHLEKSGRGFSFLRDEPLNMNYESGIMNHELTADKILNLWSMGEIEKILREYGEERFAKKIAEQIVKERKNRPIKTTFQLVEIIKKATPSWYQRSRIHPATRTFQALRIAVNDELSNIKKALPQALEILEPGGRIVVISFHSLEDRIVKRFFKVHSSKGPQGTTDMGSKEKQEPQGTTKGDHCFLRILTKKPITPTIEEIRRNPRSRSAKLRAAVKISNF